MCRTCSMHGEVRNIYTILVAKLGAKIPHGKQKIKWKDNTKMDLKNHSL
jgi:hypothetical protein